MSRLLRSGAMTSTRLWDRAAALPVPADGRRLPELAALPIGLPTSTTLFDFMRDAELRFATLRMRIEERTRTARGEDVIADGRHAPPPRRRQGHDQPGRPAKSAATTRSGSPTATSSGRTRAPTSSGPSARSATARAASTIATSPARPGSTSR